LKYREKKFALVQAEREVMPLSVRELQRHKNNKLSWYYPFEIQGKEV
jgi:hypothetical protein